MLTHSHTYRTHNFRQLRLVHPVFKFKIGQGKIWKLTATTIHLMNVTISIAGLKKGFTKGAVPESKRARLEEQARKWHLSSKKNKKKLDLDVKTESKYLHDIGFKCPWDPPISRATF